MSIGTPFTGALLALVAMTLASCGGDDGAMHATLSDGACAYRGDETPAAGRFSIEIENETLRFASFGLVELRDGATLEDIELFHESIEARRLKRSRSVPDVPPPFEGWVVGAEVEPMTRTSLPVDASAGRYVVLCYVHPNSDERRSADEVQPPEQAYAAAQLEVTGTPSYAGVGN